jgi:hypothetical protein
MRKKRSVVSFATVVLGLSALSFISVTEARDGHPAQAPSRPDAPHAETPPPPQEIPTANGRVSQPDPAIGPGGVWRYTPIVTPSVPPPAVPPIVIYPSQR